MKSRKPVATTAMNGDHLGFADNEADALTMLRSWFDTLLPSEQRGQTITGVTVETVRWNRAVDGEPVSEGYVPIVKP